MASANRHFRRSMPVLVSQRMILRLRLLEHTELKEFYLSALVKNLTRCRVAILGWAIMDGHFHLVVNQQIDGHDQRRVVGIAAFMRNVSSTLAKKVNSFLSSQGHVVERTYRSHNLERPENLLRALAYVHAQPVHHHASGAVGAYPWDSWPVLAAAKPDGVVTDLPEFWALAGCSAAQRADRLRQLLEAIILRAIALERDSQPNPWAVATAEAIAVHGIQFTPTWQRLIPVAHALDADVHHLARQLRLDWKWPRIAFDPRRAPRVGDVITVVVRRDDIDPPFF